MPRFLAIRSRIAGTIQDTLAGIAIVCFLVVVLAYLEAFS